MTKQDVALPDYTHYKVTRKQIGQLTALHQSRLQRVMAILKTNYEELEQDDVQYDYWINELTKEKQILEWLTNQTPDD